MITFVKLAATSQHVCVRLHWLEGIFLSLQCSSACPFFACAKPQFYLKCLSPRTLLKLTCQKKRGGGGFCVSIQQGSLKGPSPGLALLSWQAQCTFVCAKYDIATCRGKSWQAKRHLPLRAPRYQLESGRQSRTRIYCDVAHSDTFRSIQGNISYLFHLLLQWMETI